jgi:hypothetical protein
MVEGKSPGHMADVLTDTFVRTIGKARATSPDVVGRFEFDDGDEVLMRLGEFVPSRMVEAVVHGLDLTDALGQDPIATPEGVAMTAALLDELLARRTVPGRPADLTEGLAWVRAASGRAPHSDPGFPSSDESRDPRWRRSTRITAGSGRLLSSGWRVVRCGGTQSRRRVRVVLRLAPGASRTGLRCCCP